VATYDILPVRLIQLGGKLVAFTLPVAVRCRFSLLDGDVAIFALFSDCNMVGDGCDRK